MASSDNPPPPSATEPVVKWPTPRFVANVQKTLTLHTVLLLIILALVTAIGYKVFFGSPTVQTSNVGERIKAASQTDVRQASYQTLSTYTARI